MKISIITAKIKNAILKTDMFPKISLTQKWRKLLGGWEKNYI
jgi:hypothetical protein